MIEKAMAEIGFSVKADKSAKSQALDCIKQLQASSTLPIQRARMRIRITMPTKDGKRLKEQITGAADTVEEDDFTSDEWETVRRPRVEGHFRLRRLTPCSAAFC